MKSHLLIDWMVAEWWREGGFQSHFSHHSVTIQTTKSLVHYSDYSVFTEWWPLFLWVYPNMKSQRIFHIPPVVSAMQKLYLKQPFQNLMIQKHFLLATIRKNWLSTQKKMSICVQHMFRSTHVKHMINMC